MRVIVDQNLCGTTGQCVLTLPGIFRQREADGVAEVCVARVPDALRGQVLLAASQCPVAAIRIVDDADDHASGDPSMSASATQHAGAAHDGKGTAR